MEHLSEVVKILDAALLHDTEKASAYANLLATKLDGDRQGRQASAIRRVLAKLPSGQVGTSLASRRLPKDSENSISTIDFKNPAELPEQHLALHPYVADRVEEFLQAVELHDQFAAHGVASANRLLIYGPPGTGKTSLANVIARSLDLPLVVSRSDSLVSSLLGQTSRNIRGIFDFAAGTPCVLFLDEFDALAKDRKDIREVGELQRVVIALLQNLDALDPSMVVVAATNHPQLLDPAVWRRFDFTVRVDLPTRTERLTIWREALGRFGPEESSLEHLVEFSESLSGAAIKVVANDIARLSIRDGHTPTLPLMLRRLARVLWYDSYQRFTDDQTEIRALREWAPSVFTVRALGELFQISTRQVSNATRGM